MPPLIVTEFVTLNGVVEAPGGEPGHPHSNWVEPYGDDEMVLFKLDEVREAGSLLLGRVTYEGFAQAWPPRGGHFAEKMNAMPKHVVSSTLREPLAWHNSSLVRGEPITGVRALKEGDGDPILVAGSATLVHSLIEHDLVDELRLMVFPVVVAPGRRVLPDTADVKAFRLTGIQAFRSGVVVQTYERA